MSFSLQITDPFDVLLEKRRQELERQQAEAEARRIEQEAAEQARRAEAKRRYIQREVEHFAYGFKSAVANHAERNRWKIPAIQDARVYADGLLSHDEVELITLDPYMAQVVREKFARGLAMKAEELPNITRDLHFFGQRQDWFPALYEQMLQEVKPTPRRPRH